MPIIMHYTWVCEFCPRFTSEAIELAASHFTDTPNTRLPEDADGFWGFLVDPETARHQVACSQCLRVWQKEKEKQKPC